MAKCGWSDERSAPFSGAATGANPTDRGKRGTKRSQLSDGRGMPLAVVVVGANRHDMTLIEATLDALMIERPEPTQEHPNICAWTQATMIRRSRKSCEHTAMIRIFVPTGTIVLYVRARPKRQKNN